MDCGRIMNESGKDEREKKNALGLSHNHFGRRKVVEQPPLWLVGYQTREAHVKVQILEIILIIICLLRTQNYVELKHSKFK